MNELSNCKQELATLADYNYHLQSELDILKKENELLRTHDSTTGLLNNIALMELLKSNENRSYYLINLDNFSNVNFAYGYEFGNDVLRETARLLEIVKPQDYKLFRFCADKFVLTSEFDSSRDELVDNAQSILSFFNSHDIIVDEIAIQASLSIGISTSRGISAISQADFAIKELRHYAKNSFHIYTQEDKNLNIQQENVYWVSKIKESIINEEVIVHYQAMMNNDTNKIEKYECLSRIDDDGRLVSPFSFMEAAKATRVLHVLTKFVIEEAFKKFSPTKYEFSINITRDDLHNDYLEGFLTQKCVKWGIAPSRVVLELLEDISTLREANILEQLDSLREEGFKIAIDDFGAENSNFSRLLEFRPDYLKIDGAFIKNIQNDEDSRIITESIVDICKKWNIKSIAEYIHNKETQDIIKEIGVDYSQGYYIGEPSKDLIE